jgi:predicted transcriptional regulator
MYEFFHHLPIETLVKDMPSGAYYLDSTWCLEEAVSYLAEKKIQSAAIVDIKKKEVVGIIDTLDIVTHIWKVKPEEENFDKTLAKVMAHHAMGLAKVTQVENLSGK